MIWRRPRLQTGLLNCCRWDYEEAIRDNRNVEELRLDCRRGLRSSCNPATKYD